MGPLGIRKKECTHDELGHSVCYLTVICAWCGVLMGRYEIVSAHDLVSHGMCDDCGADFQMQVELMFGRVQAA